MTANIIDGKAVAELHAERARVAVSELAQTGIFPCLAVVLIGDNPASAAYVRGKTRACAAAGVRSVDHKLPASVAQAEVMDLIQRLNADPAVHGILVQLPLPSGLDTPALLQAIDPAKDVDGFTWPNLGAMLDGQSALTPCTPTGVMHLLDHYDIPLAGRHAVVIGRSSIVGKPAAVMLLSRHATVTICHSQTRNLSDFTASADVLIVAMGRPGAVTRDMIKPGTVVIDVGINRGEDGKLCGDVDFAGVSEVAAWITPVPGGVGPMTVAMVIHNVISAAKRTLRR